MTNQKLNLEAIAGIQEIDDSVAANYNGGVDIQLYEDVNYGGGTRFVDGTKVGTGVSFANTGFNDLASSIKITEGTWAFYKSQSDEGDGILTLSEGNYSNIASSGFNDSISYMKRVG